MSARKFSVPVVTFLFWKPASDFGCLINRVNLRLPRSVSLCNIGLRIFHIKFLQRHGQSFFLLRHKITQEKINLFEKSVCYITKSGDSSMGYTDSKNNTHYKLKVYRVFFGHSEIDRQSLLNYNLYLGFN